MGDDGNTGIRVCEGRKIPKAILTILREALVHTAKQRNLWKKNLLI